MTIIHMVNETFRDATMALVDGSISLLLRVMAGRRTGASPCVLNNFLVILGLDPRISHKSRPLGGKILVSSTRMTSEKGSQTVPFVPKIC